jgi:hypothetical protein
MVCCLFSRPDSDITLSYLFFYSKEIVKLSQDLGYITLNKEKNEANQKNIFSLIKTKKPNFIMFNGHGSPKEIFGHGNELIVNTENAGVLKDAITYSLSCSSAQILGPESVLKGARCFVGYETDFAFGKDPDSEASPRHDRIAKLFLEPSNILVSSLLRGNSVQQAVEKAKSKMLENVWHLNTTKSFPEAIHYAPFLFGNYLGLVAHGNQDGSINN